jgi:hypothetical protein
LPSGTTVCGALPSANPEWPENCQPWKNNCHLDLRAMIRPARDSHFYGPFLCVAALGTVCAETFPLKHKKQKLG